MEEELQQLRDSQAVEVLEQENAKLLEERDSLHRQVSTHKTQYDRLLSQCKEGAGLSIVITVVIIPLSSLSSSSSSYSSSMLQEFITLVAQYVKLLSQCEVGDDAATTIVIVVILIIVISVVIFIIIILFPYLTRDGQVGGDLIYLRLGNNGNESSFFIILLQHTVTRQLSDIFNRVFQTMEKRWEV